MRQKERSDSAWKGNSRKGMNRRGREREGTLEKGWLIGNACRPGLRVRRRVPKPASVAFHLSHVTPLVSSLLLLLLSRKANVTTWRTVYELDQ